MSGSSSNTIRPTPGIAVAARTSQKTIPVRNDALSKFAAACKPTSKSSSSLKRSLDGEQNRAVTDQHEESTGSVTESVAESVGQNAEDLSEDNDEEEPEHIIQETPPGEPESEKWLDELASQVQDITPPLQEPLSGWRHKNANVRDNFDYDEEKDYSDVQIICGNDLFCLHKRQLCQFGEFFKRAIKKHWSEGQKNEIVLKKSDSAAIQLTLEWIYSGAYTGVTTSTKEYIRTHPLSHHVKVAVEAQLLMIEHLVKACLNNFRNTLSSPRFRMEDERLRDDFIEACRIIYDNDLETYTRDVHYYAQDNMKFLVHKKDSENSSWHIFLGDNHSACYHALLTMHEKLHHSQFWPAIQPRTDGNAYVPGQKVSNRGSKRRKLSNTS